MATGVNKLSSVKDVGDAESKQGRVAKLIVLASVATE